MKIIQGIVSCWRRIPLLSVIWHRHGFMTWKWGVVGLRGGDDVGMVDLEITGRVMMVLMGVCLMSFGVVWVWLARNRFRYSFCITFFLLAVFLHSNSLCLWHSISLNSPISPPSPSIPATKHPYPSFSLSLPPSLYHCISNISANHVYVIEERGTVEACYKSSVNELPVMNKSRACMIDNDRDKERFTTRALIRWSRGPSRAAPSGVACSGRWMAFGRAGKFGRNLLVIRSR